MWAGASVDQLLAVQGIHQYNEKDRIKRDVENLLSQTNSVLPGVSQYVHEDGRSALLLHMEGTIPIYFKGATYNIPIKFYISEAYPAEAPRCYVTPTQVMRIKHRHQHVGPQGLVYLPYLSAWRSASSNLCELLTIMCSVFSGDPPVYKPNPGAAPPSNVNAQQPAGYGQHPPGYPQGRQSTPEQQLQEEQEARNATENSKKQQQMRLRLQLQQEATMNMQAAVQTFQQQTAQEVDELHDIYEKLQQGQNQIEKSVQATSEHHAQLQSKLQKNTDQTAGLAAWLHTNETTDQLKLATSVVMKGTWSRQLHALLSEDNAIDDTLDVLDKALVNELIPPEDFIKLVRRLAKQQFEVRALGQKIFEMQQSQLRRA